MKMDLTNNENSRLSIEGHIKIIDPDTSEVILSKRNAINFENMSVTIANLCNLEYQIRQWRHNH